MRKIICTVSAVVILLAGLIIAFLLNNERFVPKKA